MAHALDLPRLTSIVAIDRNGAIGCQNELPWSLKTDMAFFRKTTLNNTVIMGRKTYDSIGGCLKGRKNLILSRRASLFNSSADCKFTGSVPQVLYEASLLRTEDAYIIGGAYTYIEFAELVDRYIVTFVDHLATDADAYLSNSIRREFAEWEKSDIGSFPVVDGRDQFSFSIMDFTAPDAENRRAVRATLIDTYAKSLENKARRKSERNHSNLSGFRSAFSV